MLVRCATLLLIAVIPAASVSSETLAQGISKMVTITGACSTTLNQADIGCQGKSSVTTLPNGKTIVHFPGVELAIVGFAGRLQQLQGASQVLWVDGVYLNQTRILADGQCDFKYSQESVDVICRAILTDGRKLLSKSEDASFKDKNVSQATPVKSTEKEVCEKTLRIHGFLTRAQFQCGYTSYSQDLIDRARKCVRKFFDEKTFRKMTMSAFGQFDADEKERGHERACAENLRDFPNFVRK